MGKNKALVPHTALLRPYVHSNSMLSLTHKDTCFYPESPCSEVAPLPLPLPYHPPRALKRTQARPLSAPYLSS